MFNLSDMDHQRIEQMQTLYDDVLVDEIDQTLEKQFKFEEELQNLKQLANFEKDHFYTGVAHPIKDEKKKRTPATKSSGKKSADAKKL